MRIAKLRIQNIGVFENETNEFPEKKEPDKAEIHIFIGENGTGKTTLLEAMLAFCFIPKKDEEHIREGFSFGLNDYYDKLRRSCEKNSWSVSFGNGEYMNFSYIWEGLKFEVIGKFVQLQSFLEKIRDAVLPFNFVFFAYSGNRYIRYSEFDRHKIHEQYLNPFAKCFYLMNLLIIKYLYIGLLILKLKKL